MENNYHYPVTAQGQETFNHIVDVAKKLFKESGYSLNSVNKIITEAKIATGTFYIYFKDKLSLYQYILLDYKNKIKHHLHEAIKGCTTRYEVEREGLKAFIQFACEDELSYNIIWESLFIDRNIFIEYYENFAEKYTNRLQLSQECGEIRKTDIETLAYILMGISNFVGLQALFQQAEKKRRLTEQEIDFIVDNVMDVLTNGMFVK